MTGCQGNGYARQKEHGCCPAGSRAPEQAGRRGGSAMSSSQILEFPRLPYPALAMARAIVRPGFRRQIIGHSITAITLALVLVLLASGLRDFADRREKLAREAALIADLIAANVAVTGVASESLSAQAMLDQARALGYIEAAVVRLKVDGVVASFGDLALTAEGRPVPQADTRLFGQADIVRPIVMGQERVGEIRLRVSHGFLREALLRDIMLSFLALLLAGAVVFGLLYRALHRFTRRLAMITDTMAKIAASDDFRLRLPEADGDEVREVAILSTSLNAMLDEIQCHSLNLECELEQRRLTEVQLSKLSSAVENSAAGIFIADPDGWIEYANSRYVRMNGYASDDVIGQPSLLVRSDLSADDVHDEVWAALRQGQPWQGEIRARRQSGEIYWAVLSLGAIRGDEGKIQHIVGNIEDISRYKQAEETINRLAFYDPLTSLPNRRSFGELLPGVLVNASHKRELVAVCYLDLDRFKEVNDTLGHGMGDHLLQTAARRLQGVLREHDVVARLGGDEFAMVIPHLHDRSAAEVVARKIIEHMTAPFNLDGHELSVTASVGIAFFPEHGNSADELLKKADIALYRAKAMGRNNFQVFSAGLEEVGLARRELEAQIRYALEAEDFFLEYQPKLSLKTGKVCSAEALIRWNHPTLGAISPDKFIPLAEESRLIIPLGNWIINEVARQQSEWRAAGLALVPVAVNLSTMQFKHDDLPQRFSDALLRHRIGADMIELEITESLLMEDPERIRGQLDELDAMGIGIAIDDFGTGYSSLAYLKTLPVDVLKIDRTFVNDLESSHDSVITKAIIALAKSLNLQVVAEGAETQGQIDQLRSLGCDVIQGYAYSRPLTADAYARFLRVPAEGEALSPVD